MPVSGVSYHSGAFDRLRGRSPKLEDALKKTAAYEQETVTSPASDTLGGEWTVIALARSGETVDENLF